MLNGRATCHQRLPQRPGFIRENHPGGCSRLGSPENTPGLNKEKRKESEPNTHFQVPAVNLRGSNQYVQGGSEAVKSCCCATACKHHSQSRAFARLLRSPIASTKGPEKPTTIQKENNKQKTMGQGQEGNTRMYHGCLQFLLCRLL